MRLNFLGGVLAVLFVAALIIGYSSLFTVYQTQQALVIRLGQPVRVVNEPGLNVKAPFIDSVVYIDKRILDLEAPSQEVIASDQKRLVVDAFARYRIQEPLRFYQTLGSITGANSQLSILLNSALRRVLGEVTFTHVVRDQRADLMSRIRELVDREATAYGIQVVDVRIRRADLPEQNSQAVYQRMQTERQREAAEFRAQGAQRAQEIRSRADREVTVLVAEATSKSEQIRGEGDAIRNQIFADAFNQDQDFFAFYRSMQAYEHGLKSTDTRMLLKPDFKLFPLFLRSFRESTRQSGTVVRPGSRPIASSEWHVRLSGRARTGFRHRRADLCGLSRCREASDDQRSGNARHFTALDRDRVGSRRPYSGLVCSWMRRKPGSRGIVPECP